ncbi:MAG: tetratricopeptide repeat protein [Prevotella sp.]|nr:tetratricopeptide repeat protein [Prevotella sp.]
MSIFVRLFLRLNYLNAPSVAKCWVWALLILLSLPSAAQYNTDRLVTIGRSALYYEDYVLSMQYFNQAIAVKPYLYEPWFLRGVAKYHLDDFAGAESDCTEAIERNPYVVGIYELRGLTRIQQEKFAEAIADYDRALRMSPENRSLWHNRVLCHIQNKDFDIALAELDTMQARWSQYAASYTMRADTYLQMKDTTQAVEALEKSLELDPYDGKTWAVRSLISLQRKEWKEAEEQLDHAIHLLPKNGGYYINRALARYNQNNLRGAMADYDIALEIEPNNFLGHYNRGLLRADVGDDNRAITDFDFVLRLEPDNMLALFNRAVLLDRTGDLRGAVDDYTKVIDEYPNFYTGILYRARCYRRMGLTQKAELDEFKVYKSQLYQHLYGIKPKQGPRSQRKRSDIDPEKYDELVVADEQEPEREYQSDYRGRVQDRKADMDLLPLFALSLEAQQNEVNKSALFDQQVEEYNRYRYARTIFINNQHASLDSRHSADYFQYLDSLSTAIQQARQTRVAMPLLIARAVAYAAIQDNEAAVHDLTTYLQVDSASVLALWQRAACQSRLNQFTAAEGGNTELASAGVRSDIDHALRHSPQNAYLLYNRGCLHAQQQDYQQAVADFSASIAADARLGEAYYNRGICLIRLERIGEAVADLSKAGELGLYAAYSIIKKYRNNVTK